MLRPDPGPPRILSATRTTDTALKEAVAVYRPPGAPPAVSSDLESQSYAHCPLQVLQECDAFFWCGSLKEACSASLLQG